MVSADCAAKHFLFQKIISHCKCNAILENGIWQKSPTYTTHTNMVNVFLYFFSPFPPYESVYLRFMEL